MARIPGPESIAQIAPQAAPIVSEADDMLGDVGRIITSIGRDLAAKRQRADDAGFSANIAATSDPEFTKIFNDHVNTTVVDQEFVSGLDKKLTAAATDLVERSKKEGGFNPSADAINRIKLQLANTRGNFLVRATAFENNFRLEKTNEEIDSALNQFANNAALDPEQVSENIAAARELLDSSEGLLSPQDLTDKKEVATGIIALSAARSMIEQDPELALNTFLEENPITNNLALADRNKLLQDATGIIVKENLFSIAESIGVDDAFQTLDDLKRPSFYSRKEWETFIGAAQASLNQKATRLQKARADDSIDTARRISNLKIDTEFGERDAGEIITDIETEFNKRNLSESERTSLVSKVVKREKQQRALIVDDTKVSQRLQGDQSQVLTQKQVDGYFERNLAPVLAEETPIRRSAIIADYVQSTRAVPTQVKNEIENNLRSNDPNLIAQSADVIDRIDDTRGIPDSFSKQDRAFADRVASLSVNMNPSEAISLAERLTDPKDQARIDTIEQQIKDDDLREDYRDLVVGEMKPWMNSWVPFTKDFEVDPITAGQLETEYRDLFESHYKAGMTEDAAKEKAFSIIRRNWGVSQYDEDNVRPMRYPPEDYYSVDGDVEWVGEQLKNDVATSFFFAAPLTKDDEIILISDERTAREASAGAPSYGMMLKREDGISPLMGRFVPDMQGHLEEKKAESEKKIQEERQTDLRRRQDIKDFEQLAAETGL